MSNDQDTTHTLQTTAQSVRPRYRNEVVGVGLMALGEARVAGEVAVGVVLGRSVVVVAAVSAVGGGCRSGCGAVSAVSGRAGRLTDR